MSKQLRTTFLKDEHGEIVMLGGSPRSSRKRIRGFDKLFKRMDFRSQDDGTPNDILYIHKSISDAEMAEFFNELADEMEK